MTVQSEAWAYIDVVCGRPCGFRLRDICEGPLRQRCVGGVEGVRIGFVNGDVDLSDSVEVWLQPGGGQYIRSFINQDGLTCIHGNGRD